MNHNNKRLKLGVIVVAGGSGSRAQIDGNDIPKQYRYIGTKPVLAHTLSAFLQLEAVDWVLPVIGETHRALYYDSMGLADEKLLPPVIGDDTRQGSTLNGLLALEAMAPDIVMIHDGARPFVDGALVGRVSDALKDHEGALPVLEMSDTIKRSYDGKTIAGTEERSELFAAQTPQGFDFVKILAAHKNAAKMSNSFTDDASIGEWAGLDMVLVTGREKAFKITKPEDFVRAEAELNGYEMTETRVGSGMDIHQFEPGDSVRLGGVDIAHDAKLKGHSDADAALHVLTDALLGALAEGDIGTHSPPSEEKWKGEPSKTFLSFAANRVRENGGRIVHLDLTINCEMPKIGPVSEQIQANIARICDVSPRRVSVKATTSEKMGFVGRGEGLMTLGTATIELPRGKN